ncbi:hypothetical protein PSAC2689_140099 [Paraburkholderia sacchari]
MHNARRSTRRERASNSRRPVIPNNTRGPAAPCRRRRHKHQARRSTRKSMCNAYWDESGKIAVTSNKVYKKVIFPIYNLRVLVRGIKHACN